MSLELIEDTKAEAARLLNLAVLVPVTDAPADAVADQPTGAAPSGEGAFAAQTDGAPPSFDPSVRPAAAPTPSDRAAPTADASAAAFVGQADSATTIINATQSSPALASPTPAPAASAPAETAPALVVAATVTGTTAGSTVTSGTATRGTQGSVSTIAVIDGSVVAKAGQSVAVSSLFSVAKSSANPTYLILSGLDRNEYTAGYSVSAMGTLSGNGVTQKFADFSGDAYSVGVVFTYEASTGRYYNTTYGYFDQMTVKTSSNTNDNVSLSVFTTSNSSLASQYAANPYVLSDNPAYFSYVGSVSIVTQPAAAQPIAATPNSICSVAQSFVGKAWNENGCWVLASNISAEAGASLPLTSTSIGIAGSASGEWVVAYNGPVSANANWEASVTAGEIVTFETTSGGGHITTVVSGTGASAMLVDNITYVNSNGSIANLANDGSASDIVVAAPHAATQEFNGVNDSMVVVYELDTPVVSDVVSTVSVTEKSSQALAPLFSAVNPLAGQTVTEWQVYDTDTADTITVGGVAQTADHSAAAAVTVTSLANVALLAGSVAGSDTIEVRAFNGSYWGDWDSLTATVAATPAAPPTVTSQTAAQTWAQGQAVNVKLAANTFTDPQGQALSYAASQSNGQALPSWLSFNAATETFSGTVPAGMESMTLKVTATDTSGLATSETFGVTVPAAAPTVTAQTAAQVWLQGQKVSLALPSTTFTDPQGEALTYSATQANGQALPSWLSFNAATETFSGTAPTTATSLSLSVTAKDTSGLSATDTFSVTTVATAAPKAPTVTNQTTAQTWTDGQKISFSLPANTFTDPQGQPLKYAAYQVLSANSPIATSWLGFNSATDTFSGTVPGSAAGTLTLEVVATNTSGLAATDMFNVTLKAAGGVSGAIVPLVPTSSTGLAQLVANG